MKPGNCQFENQMKNTIILHLDVNSYFATMEQQANPQLRGRPIGVAGKGPGERTVIAGASMEAKKFGLYSGISTWEAKRLCPSLIIVPANYDRYIFTSRRIFAALERFSPTVDIFSIDEAWLDLTYLNDRGGWAEAIKLAEEMKLLIRHQIGEWVTCSIGISYGKILAKLASEMVKPDGLTVIRPEDFPKIALITPVEDICGIGHRLTPRLNQLGIRTVAELGRASPIQLITVFGQYRGQWLNRIGNGQDDGLVHSWRGLSQEKSVGHSYTVPKDLTAEEDVWRILLWLSERVGARLRLRGLLGRTVSVYLRFDDRTGWGQRLTEPEYLNDGLTIFHLGKRLLERLAAIKPVRLIAITVSDLVRQTELTRPLLPERQRLDRLIKAVDQVNHRYGQLVIFPAQLAPIKSRLFNLPDGRTGRHFAPTN